MGFFWNNSKSKYTTAKCCTSFESIFYSKSAGNWALGRNEPFKSHGPQNPHLKFKKWFFKSVSPKMVWFFLNTVLFYILTVFRAHLKLHTILDFEGAILAILSLILLQFWTVSINLCINFQYEVHSLTKNDIDPKLWFS